MMRTRIMRNTPEEEEEIMRGIAADPENPEWTDADFAAARPAAEVLPIEFMAGRRPRGAQKAPTKQLISIRLDPEVVAALRASGPGWQGRANALLRQALNVE